MSQDKKYISIAAIVLMLAVMIGAFGAHGLKEIVTGKYLETYKTGVTYHFYHGFGLLLIGILQKIFPENKLGLPFALFLVGIILFSFNCYLNAITQIKTFGAIVPLGGMAFIIGWGLLAFKISRNA